MPIYRIELFHFPIQVDKYYGPDYGEDSMVVGFYHEKETAIEAVQEDWCDMSERGFYQAAMVIETHPGLYPMNHQQNRWYFLYNKEAEGYVLAAEPEGLESYSL